MNHPVSFRPGSPAAPDDRLDRPAPADDVPEARYGSSEFERLVAEPTTFEHLGHRDVPAGPVDTDPLAHGHVANALFEHYAATPEGRAILEREGNVYESGVRPGDEIQTVVGAQRQSELQDLFVARVRFLRGEGGRELFDRFTPDRAATSGEARAQHDAMIDVVLAELRGGGALRTAPLRSDGLDPSLAYILASGVVEAYGSNPGLIRRILSDINDGWIITAGALDLGANGRYSSSWGLLDGHEKRVLFDLEALMNSYADPDDLFDLIAHEGAHALDAWNRTNTDGVPTYMLHSEEVVLVEERERLAALFRETGDTGGLDPYAFTNREEFWAEAIEYFLSGQQGIDVIRTASPRLYDMLRVFTGRTDLPPGPARPATSS